VLLAVVYLKSHSAGDAKHPACPRILLKARLDVACVITTIGSKVTVVPDFNCSMCPMDGCSIHKTDSNLCPDIQHVLYLGGHFAEPGCRVLGNISARHNNM
jgi:hypothetical protein